MNVFMIHFGRSGSTALAEAISCIPDFFWHGEIFSSGTYVYDGFENLDAAQKKGGGRFDLNQFLDFIDIAKSGIEKQVGHSFSRYGCEIKSYHFEYGYFDFTLDQALESLATKFPESKFIFLRRRNSFRRILSANIARKTGIYHIKEAASVPSRVHIDLDNFQDSDSKFIGEITEVLRNSAELEIRYSASILKHGGFVICYEDHIESSMELAMDLISHNLKVERVIPATTLKKTNPFHLSETIENFKELQDRLSNSELENLLK